MRRKEAKPPIADATQLRVDPADVRRYARRREETERIGPIDKLVRYAVVALMIAGAALAYFNWDTLRQVEVDLSALTNAFDDGAGNSPVAAILGGEPETVVVEDSGVAGAPIESRIGGAPSDEEVAASAAATPAAPPSPPAAPHPGAADSAQASAPAAQHESAPAAEATATAAAPPSPAAPVERPPVVVPVEPEPPPGPETFEFGLPAITVSEADASAAIIVLRLGDRRRVSSITWSTRDGTAKAGVDYVDRGSVTERYAAGEQNRTLFVPIVGDRNAEGPETFYVRVVPPDGSPAMEIEVVINDDD